MRVDVSLIWYPGHGERPRPALKITARAQRREPGGHLEEFVHTRVVDATYPVSWAAGLDAGLNELGRLRTARDPIWGERASALAEAQKAYMPQPVRTLF